MDGYKKDGIQTDEVYWNRFWRERGKKRYPIDLEIDPIYKLLEYFVPQPTSSIIEIGCGMGLRTLHFAKKHGLEATLFDYSDVALELAAENAEDLGVRAEIINEAADKISLARVGYVRKAEPKSAIRKAGEKIWKALMGGGK